MASTRDINAWCEAAAHGRGKYVFASTEQLKKVRITRAKTFGAEDWVATNAELKYRTGTPEAVALIEWADRQAEALA